MCDDIEATSADLRSKGVDVADLERVEDESGAYVYAVVEEGTGYDTGNIVSWLEANVALGLASEEYGEKIRKRVERVLGEQD